MVESAIKDQIAANLVPQRQNRFVPSTWIELNEIVVTFIAVVSLSGTGGKWLHEEGFNVTIEAHEAGVDNLDSVGQIVRLIEEKPRFGAPGGFDHSRSVGLRGEARNVETRCEVDSHRVPFGSSVHRYRRAPALRRGPGGGFRLLRGLRASAGFGLNPGRFPSPFRRGRGPRSTR
jgi:hypothetical protein